MKKTYVWLFYYRYDVENEHFPICIIIIGLMVSCYYYYYNASVATVMESQYESNKQWA